MLLKICHMTQKNMISFKQTHTNGTKSYNKTNPFTIRVEQIFRFRCSLKTTYSWVSNRRGGWNKQGGWQISAKIINGKGAINGELGKNPQS